MDIVIAIGIIILFTGLIATISYHIYLASMSVKMISTAEAYIVDIFEEVAVRYYDDINESSLVNYFNRKYHAGGAWEAEAIRYGSGKNTKATFTVAIEVKYGPNQCSTMQELMDSGELDLVKTITLHISYKLGDKQEELTVSKTKVRESLMSPNVPDINILAEDYGVDIENIYPIKYANGTWQICSVNDVTWYNYNNGHWATALVADGNYDENTIGTTLKPEELDQMGEICFWVPRYSYKYININTYEIRFNYSLSDKYVKIDDEQDEQGSKYQRLEGIEFGEGFDSATSIFDEKETGRWISEEQINTPPMMHYYEYINKSQYQRKVF